MHVPASSRPARLAITAALAAALVLGVPSLAWAAFSSTRSAGATYSTPTLQPPTNLSANESCVGVNSRVVLTWTMTPSLFATGYQIRYTKDGVPFTATVAGRTTTTTTIDIDKKRTYVFRAVSTVAGWSSTLTPATPNVSC